MQQSVVSKVAQKPKSKKEAPAKKKMEARPASISEEADNEYEESEEPKPIKRGIYPIQIQIEEAEKKMKEVQQEYQSHGQEQKSKNETLEELNMQGEELRNDAKGLPKKSFMGRVGDYLSNAFGGKKKGAPETLTKKSATIAQPTRGTGYNTRNSVPYTESP
jgi:hypothetical protein